MPTIDFQKYVPNISVPFLIHAAAAHLANFLQQTL